MNKEEITLIILVIIAVMLIIQTIFRMKFKRDMYIEHLKHYKSGTSVYDDEVIIKLFDIDDKKD